MNRNRARAGAAAAPMSDQLPPYLYNLSFIAIAMVVAALAVFAG
jgi:hypothetical protein